MPLTLTHAPWMSFCNHLILKWKILLGGKRDGVLSNGDFEKRDIFLCPKSPLLSNYMAFQWPLCSRNILDTRWPLCWGKQCLLGYEMKASYFGISNDDVTTPSTHHFLFFSLFAWCSLSSSQVHWHATTSVKRLILAYDVWHGFDLTFKTKACEKGHNEGLLGVAFPGGDCLGFDRQRRWNHGERPQ